MLRVFIIILLCSFGSSAIASPSVNGNIDTSGYSQNLPVQINADKLTILQSKHKAILEGNVKVRQGTLNITANEMIAYTDNAPSNTNTTNEDISINKIIATGEVIITLNNTKSFSKRAIFLPKEDKFIIENNVELYNNNNVLYGELLIYNLKQDTYTLTGGNKDEGDENNNENGRVKGSFPIN